MNEELKDEALQYAIDRIMEAKTDESVHGILVEFADQIAALSDDGWTYCEDRLPEEKYKYYLVTRKTGDVAISPFGTNGFDLAHVIAWRPLPEPAKGREG